MQPARCQFRSLKKSVFTSNHVDLNSKLHFYSCLVFTRLTYGAAAESWALLSSQVAQPETFYNSCMRRMMGRCRGIGVLSHLTLWRLSSWNDGHLHAQSRLARSSTLLDVTGHADAHHPTTACKPETTVVNQLLYADSIPGRPGLVIRPHYTWMDGAMQDLRALGPLLQLDLLRDWPTLALDRELWRGVASRC